MNIVFTSQKGGVSKSTLAFCVAAALHEAGRAIHFLDLDPQGSLSAWLGIAGVGDDPASSITIVDTPPRIDGAEVAKALREADKVIIPSTTSLASIQVAKATTELVRAIVSERTQLRLAWTQVQANTVGARNVDEMTQVIGVPRMRQLIHRRVCFERIPGEGYAALNGAARDEILKFTLECVNT